MDGGRLCNGLMVAGRRNDLGIVRGFFRIEKVRMSYEKLNLPAHFEIERELREQLSGRAGHQRCVVGSGELLLVVHEVPKAGVAEREALFFWKRNDRCWAQAGGPGVDELGLLLDRYEKMIDGYEEAMDGVEKAEEIFGILKHAGPMARTTRNLVQALEQTLHAEPDDREIRAFRDRGKEIERAAELLLMDARETMAFWQAQRSEEQASMAEKLGKTAFRLNLLAGFFLPLVALGGLLGMNVRLPGFLDGMFWVIFFCALVFGGVLLWFAARGDD